MRPPVRVPLFDSQQRLTVSTVLDRLALLLTHVELSIIALIGIVLLTGIVKKNAMMMIDLALDAERKDHLSSHDAIFEACMLRFRPITRTTMAARAGTFRLR